MQWRGRVARHKAQHAQNRTERARWQAESEQILLRCLQLDPLDARSYVALGKLYMGQQRFDEAARLYEDGCAATGAPTLMFLLQSLHMPYLTQQELLRIVQQRPSASNLTRQLHHRTATS